MLNKNGYHEHACGALVHTWRVGEDGRRVDCSLCCVYSIKVIMKRACVLLVAIIFLGCDADDTNRDRARWELFPAAVDGDVAEVRDILKGGVDVDARAGGGDTGFTALMFSAANGHVDVVNLLLEEGENTDLRDGYNGCTALILATRWGFMEVVKALVNAGADVNIRDDLRRSAIDYAIAADYLSIATFLRNSGARE